MVVSPGIDPYIDAVKAGDGLYLATSPELHMKRLLASTGEEAIFQITRAFRKGENGPRHNPEYTILEWYAVGRDYHYLMEETESLVTASVRGLARDGFTIPENPWPVPFARMPVDEAFERWAGWRPSADFEADRFFKDLIEKIDPRLEEMGAVFLYDYPESLRSLARLRPGDPRLSERFELYLDGLEICNGFSELTDRLEQEEIFSRYNRQREEEGREPYPVDGRFLEALEKLSPCAGNALGVDRLLMALLGTEEISEVIPYPAGRL